MSENRREELNQGRGVNEGWEMSGSTLNIALDEETLEWLRKRMSEKGRVAGVGDVIRELVEENRRLREELKACRELLALMP